ncbi:MAG: hypothetical protein ABEJ46_00170 [Gemmatimonadota bacterium]
MLEPPEKWHGGWIAGLWVIAAALLLVMLQLSGLGEGTRGGARTGSHSIPFLVAVASLVVVAVPFYCTQRWIERRGRRRGDEPPDRPEDEPPTGPPS